MAESSTPLRVSAAILRRGDRILVCRRRHDQDHPAKWEFPGGKIEGDESPEQCLRRELDEELGIDAEIGPLLARLGHSYPDGPTVDLWFFAVEGYRGELRNRVFADIDWVTAFELERIDLLEADRPVVEILQRSRG